ncbi:peptide chain release factor 2 [bacterium]|nr:peptide chain release factor 2 [bacterium]
MDKDRLGDITRSLGKTHEEFEDLSKHLKLDELESERSELEAETAKSEFWSKNKKEIERVNKKIKFIKNKIAEWEDLRDRFEDMGATIELLQEDEDEGLFKELCTGSKKVERLFKDYKIKTLLSDEFDTFNAYINIHPGAGGTESCDWANMLLRMYTRWFELKGFPYKTIELLPGDVAGIKNVTLYIQGDYTFGRLKGERGIHRLVRISPFDSNKRRHTSFASVEVYPEIDDDIEIDISEGDLRIDTFRASGAGGQHVNVTDSAVRITHLPTGTVVSCQNERSQHQNKETAMKILRSKLYEQLRAEKEAEFEKIKGEKTEIGWGHQIRSYVFHPYNMIKDLRTAHETGNVQSVMDGNLDDFIEAYLTYSLSK